MTTAQRTTRQAMRFGPGEKNMQQSYITQSLSTATHAVNLLQRDGFTVEKVVLGQGRPKVRISWHPNVQAFGPTVVYSRGNNGLPHEREEVEFEGCVLSWTVR